MLNALRVVSDCRRRTGDVSASWFLGQKKILSGSRSTMMWCVCLFFICIYFCNRRGLRKLISRSEVLIYGELRVRLFIGISSMDEFCHCAQAEQLNACKRYVRFFCLWLSSSNRSDLWKLMLNAVVLLSCERRVSSVRVCLEYMSVCESICSRKNFFFFFFLCVCVDSFALCFTERKHELTWWNCGYRAHL
jgi:hypothetical protein